ncbi:MAG: hypothetical protein KGL39_37770 [Patescibacteria group bacterium]|nr:hypothetical protein [Patescibacteria group bacterium]
MAKHTPGPYHIEKGPPDRFTTIVVDSQGWVVGSFTDRGDPNQGPANAQFRTAPELYASLKQAIATLQIAAQFARNIPNGAGVAEACQIQADECHDIIARVEGR